MAENKQKLQVFISYSHEDKPLRDKLNNALTALKDQNIISTWHDGEILAGQRREQQILDSLEAAQVILFLISTDFIASQYIKTKEATRALERHNAGDALVIPILLRPSFIEGTPIAELEMLPLDNKNQLKAVTTWRNQDSAFEAITRDIKKAVGNWKPGARVAEQNKAQIFPDMWNVPHLRNPNFTGREDLLTKLEQPNNAAITQAVAGLGGVGKTQLATEFAYRHAADFKLVWWVRAEESLSLRADLAGLAAALGLEEANAQEQQLAIEAALRWLERKGTRWLLIFDNVNSPPELKGYVPQGGDGKVIVTSRYGGDWRGVAKPLRVKVWDEGEAVQFLLNRTGVDLTPLTPKNPIKEGGASPDQKAAEELAEELGYLPLALEHAAAYVETNKVIGLAGYLKHYREKRLALLAKGQLSQSYHENEQSGKQKDTILTTWEIAFEKLGEAARDLFNLCAFLSPDEIPLSLFEVEEKWQKYVALPDTLAGLDELGWIETLGRLAEYSLVEIAAVLRGRLTAGGQTEGAGRAARLVSAALVTEVDTDIASWEVYARLQGHALAAAGETERLAVEPDATTRLLNQIAKYLQNRADYQTSLELFKRALALAERAYGLESEKVATYASNLGDLLRTLGDYQGAKQYLERALNIDEKLFGKDHPKIAIRANNLGLVLQDLGDYDGAKALYERALTIDEKLFGKDHPEVATDANNLGGVLQDLGDLQGAKEYIERALKIGEKVYGLDHPQVAIYAVSLGVTLQALGDLQGAKVLYERALKIGENVYGNDHPQMAIYANNLGSVLYAQGDYEGAKALYERAITIDEKVFGNDHPNVAIRANNLGGLLYVQGDYARAKAYFVRALAIRRKFLGEEHPNTKNTKAWLVRVEEALGKDE